MNAIEAAKKIDYRESAVFKNEFQIDVDPVKTYAFNHRAAWDPTFCEKLNRALPTLLQKNGFGEFAHVAAAPGAIERVQLKDDQKNMLEVLRRFSQECRTAPYAYDAPAADEGAGHAAAIGAALVAVAVVAIPVATYGEEGAEMTTAANVAIDDTL